MTRGPLIYDVHLSIKFTKEQKADISKAATAIGQTQGPFLRGAIIKEVRRILRSNAVQYPAERA